jgi:ParB family chromosome partitioning protein
MNIAPMLDPIELIPVDQIHVVDRLRSVNPDHAALIAESFRANGQMTPIEVRRQLGDGKLFLVAGAHRLEAAKLAEMDQIAAIVIDAGQDEARLREIDENLCRRDLTELDRAAFLAARKAVWIRLYPETALPGRKKLKTSLSSIPTFAKDVAERLGLSPRSVDRAIRRNDDLGDDVKGMLAHSRWANNGAVLDGLVKLQQAAWPAGMQLKVAEALTREENPARNLAAAIAEFSPRPKGAAAAEAAQEFDRLLGAWRKARQAARKRFIDFLVAEGEIGGGK